MSWRFNILVEIFPEDMLKLSSSLPTTTFALHKLEFACIGDPKSVFILFSDHVLDEIILLQLVAVCLYKTFGPLIEDFINARLVTLQAILGQKR